MADKDTTPRAADDRETAERKSRTVDERVPPREAPGLGPEMTAAANIPQAGIGREGPLDDGALGPGEAALERERHAQQAPIQRG